MFASRCSGVFCRSNALTGITTKWSALSLTSASRRCLFSGSQTRGTKGAGSEKFSKGGYFSFGRGRRTLATFPPDRDPGLSITSVISDPDEVPGPEGLPSRTQHLKRLADSVSSDGNDNPFDVLVVGGGATGAGIALDAATRGLKVACIERGDFASETSSRSTKLIWAGIKYMGSACSILLSPKLFTDPIETVKDCFGEMKLVFNCHTERRYMMEKQQHLCNWVPIAIPFDRWHASPPPFGNWLYGYFPILAPMVLKFYDSLSFFKCPPSHILTRTKVRNSFPQLNDADLKYCAVFYEAQHNDARTNVAIALSAAEHGAAISNYVEMTSTISDPLTGKAIGVEAVDRMTGKGFSIKAKKVIFAGGPFTDSLRSMEGGKKKFQPAIQGAHGTHIVLPGYFCSHELGILDYNTSDGRFMFILPWQNHTLVGTTDSKSVAKTSPSPPEEDIEWLLKESSKYMNPDIKIRRSDVLSAWCGWRPLAVDPHAAPDAPVSRDHVISENPDTGIIFIAGGKWTTWREMAQEVTDRVVTEDAPKCKTLDIKLFGGDGYTKTLPYQLIQKYDLSENVANHLSKSYGSRAWEVCELASSKGSDIELPLVKGFPYIEADVLWACREYACTVEDVLSRRTRLAFLNKEAAIEALPVVADIMAKELGWSKSVKDQQIDAAMHMIKSYGGAIPENDGEMESVAA